MFEEASMVLASIPDARITSSSGVSNMQTVVWTASYNEPIRPVFATSWKYKRIRRMLLDTPTGGERYFGVGVGDRFDIYVLGAGSNDESISIRLNELFMKSTVIKKKSGGVRKIVSLPEPLTAKWSLLNKYLLTPCYIEVAKSAGVYDVVHGFVPSRGCFTNAAAHKGYRWTLCMDMEDWFDRCSSVHGIHMDAFMRELGWLVEGDNGGFPQGLPTSPTLANWSFVSADRVIKDRASLNWVTYTRYADDLSFSGNDRSAVEEVGKAVRDHILPTFGHKINDKKTRLQSASFGRRIICGISVGGADEPLKWKRKLRRKARAVLHKGRLNLVGKKRINGARQLMKEVS